MKSAPSLVCAALLTLVGAAKAQISVYVSPNDIETAEDSGIIGVSQSQIFTESFNSLTAGQSINGYTSSAIGATFSTSGTVTLKPNDIYGGYGEENYLAVAKNSSTTLTLSSAAKYFGFYFTAGDAYNQIDLYSGNTLVFSFSTATLLKMLPRTAGVQITAINGTKYNTVDYYGQPVSNSNSTEAYAYINFVATGTTTFDKIVVHQNDTGSQGQIFESDNYSVLTTAPTIPGTLVVVPLPEVSSSMMLGGGFAAMMFRRRRR